MTRFRKVISVVVATLAPTATNGAQIRTPIATTVSTTPGPAPTNARAVATSTSSAAVSWDLAAGARYLIERRQVDNPTCCVAQSGYLTGGSWQDGGLMPGTAYTFSITVLYSDGRSGSTQVMATTPYPQLSLGAAAFTPCVQRMSAGPDPGTISSTGGGQVPSGATLTWSAATPTGTNYVVDRAPFGTTAWTFVGSTCGGPSPIAVGAANPTTGKSAMWMRDMAGGAVQNTKYTYRVTRIGPSSEVGWNTVAWTSSCVLAPYATATVSGSTVTLQWPNYYGNVCPGSTSANLTKPESYTLRSSFGYVKTIAPISEMDSYVKDVIYGVPVGTHTFTLTSGWRPDYSSRPSQITVTVSY
ncbi:MAG TPA: fibronectin type III domain-containing protein [Gemmatimonadaceae bacterium]